MTMVYLSKAHSLTRLRTLPIGVSIELLTTTGRTTIEVVSDYPQANGLIVGNAIYRGSVMRDGNYTMLTRCNKKTLRFRNQDARPIWINDFANWSEIEI